MKRILCFGDSNTWGAVPGDNSRYPAEVRWTGVLQKELGRDYLVIEEGLGGRTTVFDDPIEEKLSGLAYFRPCCLSQAPLDLVILMLGTNDLKTRFGVEPVTIAYGLQRFLNVLAAPDLEGNPPEVLLAAPVLIDPSYKKHPLFHAMFGEDAYERSLKFKDAYREFAKTAGISFINAADYGRASELDGLHMDPESHQRLGKALADRVREILEEGK